MFIGVDCFTSAATTTLRLVIWAANFLSWVNQHQLHEDKMSLFKVGIFQRITGNLIKNKLTDQFHGQIKLLFSSLLFFFFTEQCDFYSFLVVKAYKELWLRAHKSVYGPIKDGCQRAHYFCSFIGKEAESINDNKCPCLLKLYDDTCRTIMSFHVWDWP